jgi:hypothetical protein
MNSRTLSLTKSKSWSPTLSYRISHCQLVRELLVCLNMQSTYQKAGDKYGSIYIDQNFKHWLSDLLGKYYQELDPGNAGQKISAHATEGGQMRAMMQEFDAIKRSFNQNSADIKLDLPEPLNDLTIEGVSDGEFTITK